MGSNREQILDALERDPKTYNHLSESLRNDRDIIAKAIVSCTSVRGLYALNIPPCLHDDLGIGLLLTRAGFPLNRLPTSLRRHPTIAFNAIQINTFSRTWIQDHQLAKGARINLMAMKARIEGIAQYSFIEPHFIDQWNAL